MNSLLFEERADTLIALAIVFDRRFPDDRKEQGPPILEVIRNSVGAFEAPRLESLLERTARIESLTDVQRKKWLARWIDNIRRRGRSTKLDANIHPEQIARVLGKEPLSIRRNILNYLPLELSIEVTFLLDSDNTLPAPNNEYPADPPPEIIEVVKHHFLSNFVQIESVHDANTIDDLSVAELSEFIHHLGLREIAVACRGISSKETLAAFFCRFAEDDAKAIAMYLSTLERIDPVWVSSADSMVKRLWNHRLRTRQILHKIGLDLLASVFAQRTDTAIRYTAQKLPYRDSVRWEKMILAWKTRLAGSDERTVTIERKRAKMIRLMAGKFGENRTV